MRDSSLRQQQKRIRFDDNDRQQKRTKNMNKLPHVERFMNERKNNHIGNVFIYQMCIYIIINLFVLHCMLFSVYFIAIHNINKYICAQCPCHIYTDRHIARYALNLFDTLIIDNVSYVYLFDIYLTHDKIEIITIKLK